MTLTRIALMLIVALLVVSVTAFFTNFSDISTIARAQATKPVTGKCVWFDVNKIAVLATNPNTESRTCTYKCVATHEGGEEQIYEGQTDIPAGIYNTKAAYQESSSWPPITGIQTEIFECG